jgi:hypothetical protein
MKYYKSKILENSPEAKRRVINGISQGAALKGTFSFYLFKEYLDVIDDSLLEKYNQLMKEVFGIYDDPNAIAMFLQMIAGGQKMGGGSSKVVINEIKVNKPGIYTIEYAIKLFKELEKQNKTPNAHIFLNNKPYTKYVLSKINRDVSEEKWTKILFKNPPLFKQYVNDLELLKKHYNSNNQQELNIDEIKVNPPKLPTVQIIQNHIAQLTFPKNKLNESEQKQITIKARAICFPMLVHEIIKGLYELVSLQGFQGNKQQNQDVVDKVDKLSNEPDDIRYGQQIFNALNDIFAESDYSDSRIREFFFAEVYQLDDVRFVEFIEDAINENLSFSDKKWVDNTLKDIAIDLKNDDFNATGLDEGKSCWKNYKAIGTKKKNGKQVPNCVPIKEYTVDDEDEDNFKNEIKKCNKELKESILQEAEYQGRKVTLNKPMQGDVKKFKVYVKNDKGNIVKVNFGAKGMNIKKNNPERRKAFRARHKCDNPGPKWKARYWSCKKW